MGKGGLDVVDEGICPDRLPLDPCFLTDKAAGDGPRGVGCWSLTEEAPGLGGGVPLSLNMSGPDPDEGSLAARPAEEPCC